MADGVEEREIAAGVRSPRHLLIHPDAHPLALRSLLHKQYDDGWIIWDHQALWDQLKRDFGVDPSEMSRTKLQAIRTLETDVLFWNEWEVFGPTVMALNNRIPNFWLIQRPTPGQLMVAVDIAGSVDSREYSEEVGKFVAGCLLDMGVMCVVPPLTFAQEYIDFPHVRCDEEDRKKIEDLLENGYDLLQEDLVGVQVARLRMALDYMELRRQQLKEQMGFTDA